MNELSWITGEDTGISSTVIWSVMMCADMPRYNSTPCDPSDFGRCYRLLNQFPKWKDRLKELNKVNHKWKTFVNNYEKMEKLYEEEYKTGKCPKLYTYMQELGF